MNTTRKAERGGDGVLVVELTPEEQPNGTNFSRHLNMLKSLCVTQDMTQDKLSTK